MNWALKSAVQGQDKHGNDVVIGTLVKLDADGFDVAGDGTAYGEQKLRHFKSADQTVAAWLANADREFAATIAQMNSEEEALI